MAKYYKYITFRDYNKSYIRCFRARYPKDKFSIYKTIKKFNLITIYYYDKKIKQI